MTHGPDALYRAHGPSLHRFLVRSGAEPDVAEDILHDTFQRLLERPPKHDQTRAWLFRVAINRWKDLKRKAGRHATAIKRIPDGAALGDSPPSPERRVNALAARREAESVLAGLSHRERQLLVLRSEGLTHREIAEVLGTTTGSIGTMIARALDKVARIAHPREATR